MESRIEVIGVYVNYQKELQERDGKYFIYVEDREGELEVVGWKSDSHQISHSESFDGVPRRVYGKLELPQGRGAIGELEKGDEVRIEERKRDDDSLNVWEKITIENVGYPALAINWRKP